MEDNLTWWANLSTIFSLYVGIISLAFSFVVWLRPAPNPAPNWYPTLRWLLPFLTCSFFSFYFGVQTVKAFNLGGIVYQDVVVPAINEGFTSSRIYVNKGDTIEIVFTDPENYWSCIGDDMVPPYGIPNFNLWQQLVYTSANLCELIGYIRPGEYIAIGTNTRFEASSSGYLYLGSNDIPAKDCHLLPSTMCYGDNAGKLNVRVIVIRR